MLDDEHCVALIHQTLEHINQHLNVLKMKSRGGFIQHIEGLAGADAGSSVASLTRWASPPERWWIAAQGDVSQTDVLRVLAMRLSFGKESKNSTASLTVMPKTSDMDLPR